MSAFNAKTVSFCILLFLASSLITFSARSSFSAGSLQRHRPGSSHHGHIGNSAKVAFATFLAADSNLAQGASNDEDDGHFLSARVLAYQLLYSSTASTNTTIPFLVLCTKDLSATKRDRLRKDGATVVVVDNINWPKHENAKQIASLAKLRLFELNEYDKICFIDANTLVTKPLDGVFIDEATLTQPALPDPAQIKADEAEMPRTYVFASRGDYNGYDHSFPPESNPPNPDGAFFVFTPSSALFDYYMGLLALPNRFDEAYPVQNLLSYAHRGAGNVPWRPLWYGWNVNWPTEKDWKGGAHSFHAKYWDGDTSHDPVLKAIWREQKAEMQGFHVGREWAGH